MDHLHDSDAPEESRKFPVKTFAIGIVVLAAVSAVLVFKVPVGTVLLYGLVGIMMFSHLFMHSGHGGHDHGSSPDQQSSQHSHNDPNVRSINGLNQADGPTRENDPISDGDKEQDPSQENSHKGHSGCC